MMENVIKIEMKNIKEKFNQNAIDALLDLYNVSPMYYYKDGELINIDDSEELINLYDDEGINEFYMKLNPFIRIKA